MRNKNYFYVYRITCTHPLRLKGPKHYYGYRSSRVPPHQDTTYWSSSEYVLDAIKQFGMKYFKKKIIASFSTREESIALEIKLHSYFDVKNHVMFFNKANQTSTGFITSQPLTEDQKQKIREKATGKKHSQETKALLSELKKRKRKSLSKEHKEKIREGVIKSFETRSNAGDSFGHSEKTRKKMSEIRKAKAALGNYHTQETKNKISQTAKANVEKRRKENVEFICPYCDFKGKPPGIFTHHFKNCKMCKPTASPL